jgi:hypothetical protein
VRAALSVRAMLGARYHRDPASNQRRPSAPGRAFNSKNSRHRQSTQTDPPVETLLAGDEDLDEQTYVAELNRLKKVAYASVGQNTPSHRAES